MAQLRGTELLNLFKCQIELFDDHFERNFQPGEPQDVIDAVHDEVFHPFDVQRFVVFFDPDDAEVLVLLLRCGDAFAYLVEGFDHEILEVAKYLKPGFHALIRVQVVLLTDAAGLAQHGIKLNKGIRNEIVSLLLTS